jgi:hypothetical protein
MSSVGTLWLIFSALIANSGCGTMFCMLDGLDDSQEGSLYLLVWQVADLLSGQGSTQNSARRTTAFKLAIISRDIPGLQNYVRVQLELDKNEKIANNIKRVFSSQPNKLRYILGFHDIFRSTLQTALLQRAKRTFLLVDFAVCKLSQKQTCSQVLGVLENLPSGLPAISSRMLLQIPAEQGKTSISISKPQDLVYTIHVEPALSFISLERAISDKIALCGYY